MQATSCPNFNHRRANAPVRFCPNCGDVVNEAVPTRKCSEEKHSKKRREQSKYCIDCGEQLIAG
jgi:rRNA maturation protein Nop10